MVSFNLFLGVDLFLVEFVVSIDDVIIDDVFLYFYE